MTALIPVLELTPGSYSRQERLMPSGTIAENPDGWLRYWSESLQDAGIRGLTPWAPGSWLVPLNQLYDPALLHTILTGACPDIAVLELNPKMAPDRIVDVLVGRHR